MGQWEKWESATVRKGWKKHRTFNPPAADRIKEIQNMVVVATPPGANKNP